jgi:hypothetical protein
LEAEILVNTCSEQIEHLELELKHAELSVVPTPNEVEPVRRPTPRTHHAHPEDTAKGSSPRGGAAAGEYRHHPNCCAKAIIIIVTINGRRSDYNFPEGMGRRMEASERSIW